MARISCHGLTKRYGQVLSLDKLDLEIRDGEFLVLLGPSGCGKTTTLNCIAGLEEVTQGEIFFDDREMTYVPPHEREIAMVFQSYALYPQKTVYENIAFGLRLRKMPEAEVRVLVEKVAGQLEIEHLMQRRPAELSGGQRQRVALGRAIVRKPSVFLMDEPLSNLDASLRMSMRAIIKRLHQTMAATFVYVTHDQAEAMTMADRIVVMQKGLIEQIGSPDDIYNRPRNAFVASFLGSPQINLIEGSLQAHDSILHFVNRGTRIALDRPELMTHAGRDVVLGIRPEDLRVAANGWQSRVELVSPTGSEQYINVRLGDSDVLMRGDNELRVAPGDAIALTADARRMHVFDKKTGTSLAELAAS